MPVNVKTAPRRSVKFSTMQDLLDDAEAIAAAPHETTGNWSVSQIVYHVGGLVDVSLNGTDLKLPLVVRLFGKLIKSSTLKKGINPGIQMPAAIRPRFEPPEDIPLEESMAQFRKWIAQANEPGSMTHKSPLFGELTHEQWVQMHCRHAELHFSFMRKKEDS